MSWIIILTHHPSKTYLKTLLWESIVSNYIMAHVGLMDGEGTNVRRT